MSFYVVDRLGQGDNQTYYVGITERPNENQRGSGKLRAYLKDLSSAISELSPDSPPPLISDQDYFSQYRAQRSIMTIEKKFNNSFLLFLLSFIPNTAAYETRTLINEVKNKLASNLSNIENAKVNTDKSDPIELQEAFIENGILSYNGVQLTSVDKFLEALGILLSKAGINHNITTQSIWQIGLSRKGVEYLKKDANKSRTVPKEDIPPEALNSMHKLAMFIFCKYTGVSDTFGKKYFEEKLTVSLKNN